ncbi:hypothetical protein [Nocardia cyriacigeorgica]|uniref:hypothetical protein n=1 Tax=Nocardia cyriacigeorgica TaxID=135487 RepID=UPI00131A2575|nr:hypothetical protein [Nocardia cyriacigeorgica]MBF6326717.1 hypothetical protein [Nocardia cyriacigeorgica]
MDMLVCWDFSGSGPTGGAANFATRAPTADHVDTVVYVRDLLGGSATAVALALGCYGAGSMVVA